MSKINIQTVLSAIKLGQWKQASQIAKRLLRAAPANSQLHSLLGYANINLGNINEALRDYGRSLRLDPTPDAYTNYLALLINTAQFREVGQIVDRYPALQSLPISTVARIRALIGSKDTDTLRKNLDGYGDEDLRRTDKTILEAIVDGRVYLKDFELALTVFEKHCVTSDISVPTLLNVAKAFFQAGRYEESKQHLKVVLQRAPQSSDAWELQGQLDDLTGDSPSAKLAYLRAVSLAPNNKALAFNFGLYQIRAGEWMQGWERYGFRWCMPEFKSPQLHQSIRRWQGERIDRLLLWAEQGVGDQLYFSQLIEHAAKHVGQITLQVDSRLVKIVSERYPYAQVTPIGVKRCDGVFDAQSSMGDLAALFWKRPEDSRPACGTVQRTPRQNAKPNKPHRIGVSWASTAENAASRSIPPDVLLDALPADAEIICLQYGLENLTNVLGDKLSIPDFDLNNDFGQLSRTILECDAVLTIGNTIAHLSGFLGVPTVVLLPKLGREIWGLIESVDRYPSISLVRQEISDPGWLDACRRGVKVMEMRQHKQ
jgi:tetratricopeptide (TPR) repeat protein